MQYEQYLDLLLVRTGTHTIVPEATIGVGMDTVIDHGIGAGGITHGSGDIIIDHGTIRRCIWGAG